MVRFFFLWWYWSVLFNFLSLLDIHLYECIISSFSSAINSDPCIPDPSSRPLSPSFTIEHHHSSPAYSSQSTSTIPLDPALSHPQLQFVDNNGRDRAVSHPDAKDYSSTDSFTMAVEDFKAWWESTRVGSQFQAQKHHMYWGGRDKKTSWL